MKHELTPQQEDAIEESFAQIGRGEFVTAKELLDELRAIRERSASRRPYDPTSH